MKFRITSFRQLKHDYDDNYREFLTFSACNQTWRSPALTRGHLTSTIGKSFCPPKIQATSVTWWQFYRWQKTSERCLETYGETLRGHNDLTKEGGIYTISRQTNAPYIPSNMDKITKRWQNNLPGLVAEDSFRSAFYVPVTSYRGGASFNLQLHAAPLNQITKSFLTFLWILVYDSALSTQEMEFG